MRLSGLDFLASRNDMDAAKTAMTSSSTMNLSQPQQKPASANTTAQPQSSTMLDHELLQHYAYLRYGEGSKDNAANGGRKQHVCPVKTCGRRFSTPGNLSRHKRLHGPVKPLKCPVDGCICAFRSENKLEKHMKFHLGIPVHVCPVPACGKTFSTAGNLNRHIKGHHPHVDPFNLKLGGDGGTSLYSASTSSSCDESSVGGDEVVRERFEEEAARQKRKKQAVQFKREPSQPQELATATAVAPTLQPSDHLDALVAILDQDIGAEEQDVDMSMPSADLSAETESESMLSLLLLDKPTRKYSLLDDMIRFHINHFTLDQTTTADDNNSSSASDTWVL